jgi:hypothetical protein
MHTSFTQPVDASAPHAAPHPNPLPVAHGVILARAHKWLARGRLGEGAARHSPFAIRTRGEPPT